MLVLFLSFCLVGHVLPLFFFDPISSVSSKVAYLIGIVWVVLWVFYLAYNVLVSVAPVCMCNCNSCVVVVVLNFFQRACLRGWVLFLCLFVFVLWYFIYVWSNVNTYLSISFNRTFCVWGRIGFTCVVWGCICLYIALLLYRFNVIIN